MTNKIENELPDFNDMQKQADAIYECSVKKGYLNLKIQATEADITRKIMSDTAYWMGGKAPSMAFVESTYLVTGLDNELIKLRKEYIEASADLEKARLSLELMKTMIDVWRSRMASERIAVTS